MLRKFASALGSVGVFILLSAVSAVSADDGVPFPNGFRDWFFVNSLTAPADSPLFGHVGGVHHIYVNARGLPTLKAGGPFRILTEPFSRMTFTNFGKGWRFPRRRQEICDGDGEGRQKVRGDWGMGIPSLGCGRPHETTNTGSCPLRRSLLCLPYSAKSSRLHIFQLHSLRYPTLMSSSGLWIVSWTTRASSSDSRINWGEGGRVRGEEGMQ